MEFTSGTSEMRKVQESLLEQIEELKAKIRSRRTVRTQMNPVDVDRIVAMARFEVQSFNDMVRILILDSLKVWESSQPGRTRRKSK